MFSWLRWGHYIEKELFYQQRTPRTTVLLLDKIVVGGSLVRQGHPPVGLRHGFIQLRIRKNSKRIYKMIDDQKKSKGAGKSSFELITPDKLMDMLPRKLKVLPGCL